VCKLKLRCAVTSGIDIRIGRFQVVIDSDHTICKLDTSFLQVETLDVSLASDRDQHRTHEQLSRLSIRKHSDFDYWILSGRTCMNELELSRLCPEYKLTAVLLKLLFQYLGRVLVFTGQKL